jgi:murein L,D-transpeptidase YcbB/YkuD
MKLQTLFACSLTLAAAFPGNLLATGESINKELAQKLVNAPAEVLGFASEEVSFETEDRELYEIYHENGLQALWVSDAGPGKHASALLNVVSRAAEEGLNPADYQVAGLRQHWESRTAADLAELDLLVSLALVAWVNDTSEGRVHTDPGHPDRYVRSGDRRLDPVSVVQAFRQTDQPEKYLAGLNPQHRFYVDLRTELGRFRTLAANGGWSTVDSEGGTLHPGERDARVHQIRQRLSVTGEFKGDEATSDVYDEPLQQAVKQFQLFHGLAPDGVAGPQTFAEMNVPVEYRIRQIEMNMERWRWNNHDLENPYILVDIAGFDVQGVKDDEALVEMRAIVGKLHHETPIFSDHIKYIEFNPYWNLTPSIARHETVPKARKDPNYLASKHIRVFDGWGQDAQELDPASVDWNSVTNPGKYKFRQDPGPWNALGTMKFIFPNEYSVYLHDTPNHDLFEQAERSFSHGCIRLSEPSQLAEWVLKVTGSDWTMENIEEVLESKQRTVKNLDKPLAVHLTYETAWIDGDSRIRFAHDLYGRDAKLEKALYGE